MMRQPKRRYQLVSENGRGKVVHVESDDETNQDRERLGAERPGAETRVRLPWVAVPRRD